uniref:Uncharacterized protein n=1 Tax=Anguilla anguilla TaxID=7936 RepID=A0A0E9TVC3_ANGAN
MCYLLYRDDFLGERFF